MIFGLVVNRYINYLHIESADTHADISAFMYLQCFFYICISADSKWFLPKSTWCYLPSLHCANRWHYRWRWFENSKLRSRNLRRLTLLSSPNSEIPSSLVCTFVFPPLRLHATRWLCYSTRRWLYPYTLVRGCVRLCAAYISLFSSFWMHRKGTELFGNNGRLHSSAWCLHKKSRVFKWCPTILTSEHRDGWPSRVIRNKKAMAILYQQQTKLSPYPEVEILLYTSSIS